IIPKTAPLTPPASKTTSTPRCHTRAFTGYLRRAHSNRLIRITTLTPALRATVRTNPAPTPMPPAALPQAPMAAGSSRMAYRAGGLRFWPARSGLIRSPAARAAQRLLGPRPRFRVIHRRCENRHGPDAKRQFDRPSRALHREDLAAALRLRCLG